MAEGLNDLPDRAHACSTIHCVRCVVTCERGVDAISDADGVRVSACTKEAKVSVKKRERTGEKEKKGRECERNKNGTSNNACV